MRKFDLFNCGFFLSITIILGASSILAMSRGDLTFAGLFFISSIFSGASTTQFLMTAIIARMDERSKPEPDPIYNDDILYEHQLR